MDEQRENLYSRGDDNGRNSDRRCQDESHPHVGPRKSTTDVVRQPNYLHQDTLVALSVYLSTSYDKLYEDELVDYMVQIDKIAAERIRNSEFLHDSEEEEGVEDVYQQEEDFALTQDFFKKAVTAAQVSGPLDKRTLNWIRKEMELKRRRFEAFTNRAPKSRDQTDESEDSGDLPRKRMTRTYARNARVKKREERSAKDNQGLKDLLSAVQELEVNFAKSLGTISDDKAPRNGSTRLKEAKFVDYDLSADIEVQKKKSKSNEKPISSNGTKHLVSDSTKGRKDVGPVARKRKDPTHIKDTKIMNENTNVNALTTPKRRRRAMNGDISPSKKGQTEYLVSPKTPSFRSPASIPKISKIIKMPKNEKIRTPSKRDADTPISLSLLEWRRRHQWTPSKEQRTASENLKSDCFDEDDDIDEIRPRMLDEEVAEITIPVTYKDEGIDLHLPTWEVCNPVGQIAFGEPPVMEPSRLVYTDDKYAAWCTEMIHSLTGCARYWARYEFFYSDLDRPWFNFNEFQVNLAKHGISPTVKLSRREWSEVRKAIWGKPRRFSRKFVQDELDKLNSYRNLVRLIQHSDMPKPLSFGYQVYAAIKVGHVVTAFNRRFRILQRGTVLMYDLTRKMYMIQFEHNEVGFEFVPDFDVAAHGVPELIHEASEVALDETLIGSFVDRNNGVGSMLCGTLYGRNSSHSVRQNSLVMYPSNQGDNTFLKANDNCVASLQHENTYLRPFLNSALVEKVSEREIVTKLIEFIDLATKRKLVLLEALDALNQQVSGDYSTDQLGYSNLNSEFQQHYAWLMANYEVTTECLESLMVHLQVMYGRGYAGRGGVLYNLPNNRAALDTALLKVNINQPLDPYLSAPWIRALSKATSSAACMLPTVENGSAPRLSYLEKQRLEVEKSRQQLAAQFLMATNYATDLASDLRFGTSVGTNVAATLALKDQHDQLTAIQIPFYTGTSDALHAVNDRRTAAIKELGDAIESLHSEIAAKHAVACQETQHKCTFAAT